jgi:hypothetical protein
MSFGAAGLINKNRLVMSRCGMECSLCVATPIVPAGETGTDTRCDLAGADYSSVQVKLHARTP